MRRLAHITSLRTALSLMLALGIGLARYETAWAKVFDHLDTAGLILCMPKGEGHEPFDPRRVPPSGGVASRLLSGMVVRHA